MLSSSSIEQASCKDHSSYSIHQVGFIWSTLHLYRMTWRVRPLLCQPPPPRIKFALPASSFADHRSKDFASLVMKRLKSFIRLVHVLSVCSRWNPKSHDIMVWTFMNYQYWEIILAGKGQENLGTWAIKTLLRKPRLQLVKLYSENQDYN